MSCPQPSHGGPRPGAGRPPKDPGNPRVVKLSVRVGEGHIEALDRIRERYRLTSRTDALVLAIERADSPFGAGQTPPS